VTSEDSGSTRRGTSAIGAIAALSEPTRRRIYEAVRDADAPLTRDEVAAALSLSRPIAAFHLDALARAGLLLVDYARPAGRRGPGAGRPAKRYRLSPTDVSVSLPERRYDLTSQILAAGVQDAGESGSARAASLEAAAAKGRELARAYAGVAAGSDQRSRVEAVLADLGYQPFEDAAAVRLRNCPFHAAVETAPDLVCHLNLALLQGLLDELGLDQLQAHFEPTANECCVHIRGIHPGDGRKSA
jgi:predicted ArsR family transcriptional regulator